MHCAMFVLLAHIAILTYTTDARLSYVRATLVVQTLMDVPSVLETKTMI
jgi:hypothetical protein